MKKTESPTESKAPAIVCQYTIVDNARQIPKEGFKIVSPIFQFEAGLGLPECVTQVLNWGQMHNDNMVSLMKQVRAGIIYRVKNGEVVHIYALDPRAVKVMLVLASINEIVNYLYLQTSDSEKRAANPPLEPIAWDRWNLVSVTNVQLEYKIPAEIG